MKGTFVIIAAFVAVAHAGNGCPSNQESDWSIEKLLVHADCDKFYKCTYGEPVEKECPAGLLFNIDSLACDWPENVDCSNRDQPDVKPEPKPEPESGPEPESVPEPTPAPESETEGEGETEEEQESGYLENGCPADFSRFLLLPSSASCNEYFVCSWGQLISRNCPAGQHFAFGLQTCILPVNSPCRDPEPEAVPEPTPAPESEPESDGEIEQEQEPGYLENGCPADFSRPQLLPSSASCNEYFVCSWGELIPRNCPEGLHFSSWVQSCVLPVNSSCRVSYNKHRK